MEWKEEHSGLFYKTKIGDSLRGKSKIYFCGTVKDQPRFFEEICGDLFRYRPDCAVFYRGPEDPGFTEARQEVLAEMQLFVMPVTTELLTKDNPARCQEYPFALENKIPVLPLMEEQGLEELFNRKCGELQFLNKHDQDSTAISYEEKLKKYLESVLIGDEMAEKIRSAFDAYIFLSYRKKDRKQAQSLMRLIHKNEEFQNIAIWYDEFLVPGENFNEAIGDALRKCDVFTLLVTPNLVNEPNYVQQKEYPAAVKYQKPILPVEAEKTDQEVLKEQYPEVPHCAALEEDRLSEEMHSRLTRIALGENDHDPQHLFFIGLAYLSGIDVERDPERAERLLTRSADLGLPEAAEKLSLMYENGEGVDRNFKTSIKWRSRQAELLEEIWDKEETPDAGDQLFHCLSSLGAAWWRAENLKETQLAYSYIRDVTEERLEKDPDDLALKSQYGFSSRKIGDVLMKRERFQEAEAAYLENLMVAEQLAKVSPTIENIRTLSYAYCKRADVTRVRGSRNKAGKYLMTAWKIVRSLEKKNTESEMEVLETRRISAMVLKRIGEMALEDGRYDRAEVCGRYYLMNMKKWMEIEDNYINRERLAMAFENMGDIYRASGKKDKAEDQYWHQVAMARDMLNESGSLSSRRILVNGYEKIGSLALERGDRVRAHSCYSLRCLGLSEELARESGTVEDRRQLAWIYYNLCMLNPSRARFWSEKCVKLLMDLFVETGDLSYARFWDKGEKKKWKKEGLLSRLFQHKKK